MPFDSQKNPWILSKIMEFFNPTETAILVKILFGSW